MVNRPLLKQAMMMGMNAIGAWNQTFIWGTYNGSVSCRASSSSTRGAGFAWPPKRSASWAQSVERVLCNGCTAAMRASTRTAVSVLERAWWWVHRCVVCRPDGLRACRISRPSRR
jgi:hypothetical protein